MKWIALVRVQRAFLTNFSYKCSVPLTTALRGENDKPSDISYILHNYNIKKSYQYRQTTTTNIQSILHIQSKLWKPLSQYDMLTQKDYIHYNSIQITNYIHCIVPFYKEIQLHWNMLIRVCLFLKLQCTTWRRHKTTSWCTDCLHT